jgi:hypothetical protein
MSQIEYYYYMNIVLQKTKRLMKAKQRNAP